MITEQQIIEILKQREENIDGGETIGVHFVQYGNVAKAIMKLIPLSLEQRDRQIAADAWDAAWKFYMTSPNNNNPDKETYLNSLQPINSQ